MKIKVKQLTMIQPALDLPAQSLWLSNFDILHEINHIPSLYLYKSHDSRKPFESEVLKEALSKVLVAFYPVAGRLARDANGRLEINCNGELVLFIDAETDSAIDDLGDLMLNLETPQLLPSVDYSQGISSFPLFVLQVTKFMCGGLSLGLRLHHTIADGFAALHFINTWCDVARGLAITQLPFIDLTILHCRVPPTPKFEHVEYHKPLSMDSPTQNQPNSIQFLQITPQQLATLKANVNNGHTKTNYSSYEILAAHIWRCTCKARNLLKNQQTKLYAVVNGRFRLQPSLPPGYFGNAISFAAMIALCGDLLSEPLECTVERIDKAIKGMDDEYFRSGIDYLELLDDLKPILRGAQSLQCPNMTVVSWMRLPLYEADFGMGKPMYVRPANPIEGLGYLLRTPTDDGTWALAISLPENQIQPFQKSFYELFDV